MRLCPAVRRLLRAGRGVSDSWLPTISGRPAKLANRAFDPGRAWRRNMSLSRVICLAPMGIDRWPLGRVTVRFPHPVNLLGQLCDDGNFVHVTHNASIPAPAHRHQEGDSRRMDPGRYSRCRSAGRNSCTSASYRTTVDYRSPYSIFFASSDLSAEASDLNTAQFVSSWYSNGCLAIQKLRTTRRVDLQQCRCVRPLHDYCRSGALIRNGHTFSRSRG